ncbi:hypothetical protein IU429_17700 [Nocardia elegans]|uniref:hypothetical protein n=1 Tax=Nocardia elegans TaxID=300029 RepID=UPI001893C9A9|nr:hypothetical protein [Nocardia elegans]MBF6449508.1 hypothetical protein [Nocardia elegans]
MSFDWDRWLFEIQLHPEFFDSTYELAEQIRRCMTQTGEELFEYEHGEIYVMGTAHVTMYPFYDLESGEPIVLRSGVKPVEDLTWREYQAEDIISCLCELVEFGYFEEVVSDYNGEKLEVPAISETGVDTVSVDYDIWHKVVRPSFPETARDLAGRPVFPQAS